MVEYFPVTECSSNMNDCDLNRRSGAMSLFEVPILPLSNLNNSDHRWGQTRILTFQCMKCHERCPSFRFDQTIDNVQCKFSTKAVETIVEPWCGNWMRRGRGYTKSFLEHRALLEDSKKEYELGILVLLAGPCWRMMGWWVDGLMGQLCIAWIPPGKYE